MTRTSWFFFIALAVIWGVPFYFTKVALVDLSPGCIAFGRVFVGALILSGFVPRAEWRAVRRHIIVLAAAAIMDIALPFALIANGERTVSSSLTGLILSAIPIAVTLLAPLLLPRERLSRIQRVGLGVGIAGVAALLGGDIGRTGAESAGVFMIVGAMLSYSIGALMIRRWLGEVAPLATAAAMLITASLFLAPAAAKALPAHAPGVPAILAVLVLGALCTGAAYVMDFSLIASAGPFRASVVSYLNPAVAAVLGVALLHESMSVVAVAGLLLVIAGSWLTAGGPPPRGRAIGKALDGRALASAGGSAQ